jgi:ribose 5-phosphate isomerase B
VRLSDYGVGRGLIMKIAVGSDHRGLELKKFIMKLVTDMGHSCEDFGSYTSDPVDYPDIAKKVAEAVAGGDFERGVLICDTGIGMCIAANKVKGIRAARCLSTFDARRARQHNDANVLCLAAQDGPDAVSEIVTAYLTSEFEGGRHQRRLDKVRAMEG